MLGVMRPLYDIAYSVFGVHPYCDSEAVALLSRESPGHTESEYVEAIESVMRLAKCADRVCSDWYDHRHTESEAKDLLRVECPGFDEDSYTIAWNRAVTWVHK